MYWDCLSSLWFWMLTIACWMASDCHDYKNKTAINYVKPNYNYWDYADRLVTISSVFTDIAFVACLVFIVILFIHLKWWIVCLIIPTAFFIMCLFTGGILRPLLKIYPDKTAVFSVVVLPLSVIGMFVSFYLWL